MKEKWQQLKNRFEAFETRERLLLVGAAAAVLYLLWDFLLLQPMGAEMKIMQARERVAKQSLQTSNAELTVLSNVAKKDPNLPLKRDLQELQTKLQELDQRLNTLANGLVAAEKLPAVLHDVLRQTGKLKIVSMATLPPEEVLLNKDAAVAAVPPPPPEVPNPEPATNVAPQDAPPAASSVKIYKHTVTLRLTGDFASVLLFLQSLEQGAWQFYWESLQYRVTQYPSAEVLLNVFTLSSQRGVLDGK